MPYIKQSDRPTYDKDIESLTKNINSSGETNYVITSLLHLLVQKNGMNYDCVNTLMGVLTCVQQEFYRKVVVPYEELKIQENGDINILGGN